MEPSAPALVTVGEPQLDPPERMSIDAVRALQLKRLRLTLWHAYDRVPHYRAAFAAASVYPDDITRQIATDLAEADTFRFDLSDLTPPAFGATQGQGEWKIMQDYLANPGNPQATAQQLEQAASKAD